MVLQRTVEQPRRSPAQYIPATGRRLRVDRGLALSNRHACAGHALARCFQSRAGQCLVEQPHEGKPGNETEREHPILALAVEFDNALARQVQSLRQPLQFGADPGVIPDWQHHLAPGGLFDRPQVIQHGGDQRTRLARSNLAQVVVQHQRGIGRDYVQQPFAEHQLQTLAGRHQPGDVAFLDSIEQAQGQAVDGGNLDARLHAGNSSSRAWRILRTAAMEPSLSPWTHSVSTCRFR
ncbi:hypothetical protein D3C76_920170 [compost metagenome]